MMQRPLQFLYDPSDQYRRWKRRQRNLLIVLAVLLVLEVGLVTRGVMLLKPDQSGAVLAPMPTATATSTPSPTPTPRPTPPAPVIQADGSMLVDSSTGAVLFRQHADDELPMASTTKIMTALLALRYGHLDQLVTIGADAVAAGRGDNSHMGVSQGEVLTLRDLLYGLMLPSGDDAAVAVADAIGGDEQHFVALMNRYAQFLGLTHTHYVNVHGLDAPGHYTSASDLIKLTRYALRIPLFAIIVSTPEYKIPATNQHKAYNLRNTNELLGADGYAGADGVKTGTTGRAGYCMVFSATRDGTQLLGVILGAPSDGARFREARALLDWGFTVVGAEASSSTSNQS